MVRLSGMVICKNEAARIGACLDSIAFCDELVVVDSGSTDGTLDILRSRGVRLFERPYTGMNDQKDFGREVARGEWLLNLDADEVCTPELAREVQAIATGGADRAGVDAYRIPFRNHFRGVWVRRSGYYPDPHIRFVRRDRVRWDKSVPAHDRVLVEGAVGLLSGHVDHYSFNSIAEFVAKSSRFAEAFAKNAHAAGRRAGLGTILVHTLGRFAKAYFLELGCLEGTMGLAISGLQSYEVFQKYLRLWELGRFSSREADARAISSEASRGRS